MVNSVAAFRFLVLCLGAGFAALDLSAFLNSQCGGAGSTTCGKAAPLLDSAAEVLPPLAALGVLFAAVVLIYHHLMVMGRRVGGGAGNGRRSIAGLVIFMLCVSAGALQFILFGQAAGSGGGARLGAQQARALGLAALRALPAVATVTFFCGMVLIVAGVAHVRAGGEAGGTDAVAGHGAIQGLLRVLPKVAAVAAAALVGLMAMAFALCGAK